MAECYECGNTVDQLSKRSRCVDCECERSLFNERENERLRQREETLEDALQKIVDWSNAYPRDIFPDPDWDLVKRRIGSSRLSQVSAANMRHVVEGVGEIAQQALVDLAPQEGE